MSLLVVTTLISCSTSDDVSPSGKRVYVFSAIGERDSIPVLEVAGENDTPDVAPQTRALFIGGSAGNNYIFLWDKSDMAKVYKDNAHVGTLTPVSKGDQHSELTGELTGDFSVGDELLVCTPSADMNFIGQDGTLGTLSTKYCHMSTNVKVKSVQDGKVTTEPLIFSNRHAYGAFKFKSDQDSVFLHVKQLTIHVNSGLLVASRTADGTTTHVSDLVINLPKESKSNDYPNIVYVAILNDYTGKDTYSFTVVDKNDKTYIGQSINALLSRGVVTTANRFAACTTVDVGTQTSIMPPEGDDPDVKDVTL